MSEFRWVARAEDLDASGRIVITLDGREVVVARLGEDEYRGFANRCTCLTHFVGHNDRTPDAWGRLAEGHLEDGRVQCPLHGTVYDLRSGSPVAGFGDQPISTYEVRCDGGGLLMSLMTDAERLFWNDPDEPPRRAAAG